MASQQTELEAGVSVTSWGNDAYALAYHAGSDATLEYSPDDGANWRTAITTLADDAIWTAAGHKIVMLPAGCDVRAVTGDIFVLPMATATVGK